MKGGSEKILKVNYGLVSCPGQWYLLVYGHSKSTGSKRFLITPLLRCGPSQRHPLGDGHKKETRGEPHGFPLYV